MTRLISAEFFKLRKRLMTQVLLYVLIGIIVVLYLLLYAVSKVRLPANELPAGTLENLLGLPVALPFAMSILVSFGSVLAVILTASIIGNEYNWRTIRTMLTCSESRLRLLGAKLISVSAMVLAGMAIALTTGFLMSLLTTYIGGYSFDFTFATSGYLWDQFLQFWRTLYVLMPYTLLGFLFAIVGRSAMPGIALGIGVYFLESIVTAFMVLAGGWVAKIPDYLPSANVRAINALNQLPQGIRGGFASDNLELPGITHAYITLAIYSLIFFALAFYLFRKRDVTTA